MRHVEFLNLPLCLPDDRVKVNTGRHTGRAVLLSGPKASYDELTLAISVSQERWALTTHTGRTGHHCCEGVTATWGSGPLGNQGLRTTQQQPSSPHHPSTLRVKAVTSLSQDPSQCPEDSGHSVNTMLKINILAERHAKHITHSG